MTSYQKLKKENQQLKKEIYILVMNPDTFDGIAIKARYKLKFEITDNALLGKCLKNHSENRRKGVLNYMKGKHWNGFGFVGKVFSKKNINVNNNK